MKMLQLRQINDKGLILQTKKESLKEEDYFLYVTQEDEEETLEVLGINKSRHNPVQEEYRIVFDDLD